MRIVPIVDVVGGPLVAATASLVTALEALSPLRARRRPRRERWRTNAALGAIAALIVRAGVVPTIARLASRPRRRARAAWATALTFAALDASMYAWHRLNHRAPWLWRFHEVHHTDLDVDASTALRFHAGELLASIPFRALQTLVLRPTPRLALAYEVAMQAAATFHHANVRLPAAVDRALAAVVVTPRLHGIHHSIEGDEVNANWSVVFSFWDRLFGTLRDDVAAERVTVGVATARDPRSLGAGALLARPFAAARRATV